ncbi:MAG: glycosyltransferase [Eubacteriales bacterium]|nr:glycosyltransferase [Eubacteriales bacterium]
MRQLVGKVVIDDTFYPGQDLYSDGSVEDELLKLVKKYPESEFNEVIARESSWPVLYHLSHIRGNILEWLPITKEQTVLEIGSGCGAITGVLSKKAKAVTCIELSKRRSMINATRNQACDNVEIMLGNFQTVEQNLEKKFDWITLIGVFEYGQLYIASENPFVDFLETIKKHLAPGGRIVIAIENRLGLKYFAGCTEDHTGNYFEGIEGYVHQKKGVKTFSRPELETILREAGLDHFAFYYPYPDYKLPMTMYSDRNLPKAGELRDNMRNFDRERYLLFDESRAYDSLIKDGLFPIFSNSYLVVAGGDAFSQELVYTKYSNERAQQFAIRTDILEQKDGRHVRKSPCSEDGRAHVQRIAKWYEKLNNIYKDTPISMNRVHADDDGVEVEFLSGHTLEEELDQTLATGDVAGVTKKLLDYIEIVRKVGSAQPFSVTPEFMEVFGSADLPQGMTSALVTDIDLVVSNAVIQDDGWTLIDYEWTFEFPVPVNYVIYRILYFYVYGNSSRAALYAENLYEKAGLTTAEVKEYWEMEEHFQQYVLGKVTPLRLLYPKISHGHIDLRAEDAHRKQTGAASPANKQSIVLCVDRMERTVSQIHIEGWAVSLEGRVLDFAVQDAKGEKLEIVETKRYRRRDVNAKYSASGENALSGFCLTCTLPEHARRQKINLTLTASCEGASVSAPILEAKISFMSSRVGRKILKLAGRDKNHHIQYRTYNEMGLLGATGKLRLEDQQYDNYRIATAIPEAKLEAQRSENTEQMPKLAVCFPQEEMPQDVKSAMEEALQEQTYGNVTDASKAEYLLLLQTGEVLEKDALFSLAKYVEKHTDADAVYTDEDRLDLQTQIYSKPLFKPDYSPFLLQSGNYIGGAMLVKRTLAEKLGGYDHSEARYDFMLRLSEQTKRIAHLPRVLSHRVSMPHDSEKERQLAEREEQALLAHYERMGLEAEVSREAVSGYYRTSWEFEELPLISIIIPNKDHIQELDKCLKSIYSRSSYPNFEVLVVENNSEEASTFAYYRELETQFSDTRVITWDGEFNYAAINNFAAKQAKGEYLLFLNNDTEVISKNWMEEMLGICRQSAVGAVGAKLFYPDGSVQHAGVIVGLGRVAGHLFIGQDGENQGYMRRAGLCQNLSAVTAACMMTKKEAFRRCGGFDEKLRVTLNDVDYCMKLTDVGYQVVYTPYAQLFHYESKSRGQEDTLEKQQRREEEISYFQKKWPEIFEHGDPYYNINLSRTTWNCSLRIPR